MDLTEFLAARLDEDEAAARRLAEHLETANRGGGWSSTEPMHGGNSVTIMTAWLPDRVLREVEAKRAIIAEHELVPVTWDASRYDFGCTICHDWDGLTTPDGYCATLRALAAVYSTHPDYRAEWKP